MTVPLLVTSEAGSGGRPVMLVHGFTGGRTDFADHMAPLAAAGWHVVAPDLRGHGSTGGPRERTAYTVEQFVADLITLADDLGWDEFVLLGHSMGGVIAQQVALDHPQRLDGLILMDTAHGPLEVVDDDVLALGAQVAIDNGMAALVELLDSLGPNPNETEAYARMRDERPHIVEGQRANMLAVVPEAFAACGELLATEPDRLERLSSLDVPTLILFGELDEPFVADSGRLAETIPDAELAVIDASGHAPQWEQPDAWYGAIADFLARLPRTGDGDR